MRKTLILFAFSCAVLCPVSKAVKVAFKGHINGYPVIFIDTEFGNLVRFGTIVPTGMGLDEPVTLEGISHLIEHQVFRRTDKFEDGEGEVQRISRQMGGGFNAFTGGEVTAFHMNGHPDALPLMIAHIGAMMSSFRPEPVSFAKERSVVIEESKQYLARDSLVLWEILAEQLPAGHFLRKYSIGRPEYLQKMDLDLALDYYYANYQPHLVNIIVAGNFSGPLHAQTEKLKTLIRDNFHAPEDRRQPSQRKPLVAGRSIQVPSLLSDEINGMRLLEVKSKSQYRALVATFQLPDDMNGQDFDALGLVHETLALQLPGSLVDRLDREKGWINSLGFQRSKLNNLNTADLFIKLSEKGEAHRYEILSEIFSLVGKFSREGIPADLLKIIKEKEIASYRQGITSPVSNFMNFADAPWRIEEGVQFLDPELRFAAVTDDHISRALQSGFPVDKLLVRYMGPDIEGEASSNLLDRPFRFEKTETWFDTWKKAQEGVLPTATYVARTEGIEVSKSMGPRLGLQNGRNTEVVSPDAGLVILNSETNSANVGLVIRLQVALLSNEERAAMTLFFSGVRNRMEPTLAILNIQELVKKFAFDSNGEILLALEGPREAVRSAALTISKRYASEKLLTEEEVARERQSFRVSLQESQQGFTSSLATRSAMEAISRPGVTMENFVANLDTISSGRSLQQIVDRVFARGCDIRLSAVGNILPEDLQEISGAIRRETRLKPLSQDFRHDRLVERLPLEKSISLWRPLPNGQNPDAVGIARLYGPIQGLTEARTAFRVLEGLIAEEVFTINRAEKGLGYTHGARRISADNGDVFLGLYGQAMGTFHDGPPGQPRKSTIDDMLEGWVETLQKVKERKFPETAFSETKLGIARTIELIPGNLVGEAMERDVQHEQLGRTDARQVLGDLIKRMTIEEIYTAAENTLFAKPWVQVVTSAEKPSSNLTCGQQIVDFASLWPE